VSTTAAAQSAFCIALFDELARGGMLDVVVCPGSRSTPLVLALARERQLRMHVRLDERSAGFFAIGRSIESSRPTGLVVTSGTAVAELMAAVVEADLSGVPLVVISADRPPELRGVGAPQTIDQVKLFGSAVRRFEDPGTLRPGAMSSWRALAARVLAAAVELRGPVHLNVPFVEPLDEPPSEVPAGRPGTRPWRRHLHPQNSLDHHSALVVRGGDTSPEPLSLLEVSGLLVAGKGAGEATALCAAASGLGWPVLADPLSCARLDDPHVVAGFDALLRDRTLRDGLRPEVVVVLGSLPASRALADALAAWGSRIVLVSDGSRPHDPAGLVSDVVVASPGDWTSAVAGGAGSTPASGTALLEHWRAADAAVQASFDTSCAQEFSEPGLARLLTKELLEVPLIVSNSMPVRDVEWFGAKSPTPVRTYSNRGANGIDGVVSTALGVACGGRAVGLVGDLAFLHDAGSIADGVGAGEGRCVLVVPDNDGGAIFSFLPQRSSVDPEVFERAFGTPPRVRAADVAAGYGAEVATVKDYDALRSAIDGGLERDGVTVVVADVPDRDRNVELHRSYAEAGATAARRSLGW
jgi:2-succinyl-5-enolpyruvyl-6-hydroxy-3-cyclohexene-1-carboxylate synthase